MKVQVVIDVYPECADPDNETGLTEDAYMALFGVGLPGDVEDVQMVEGR